LAKNSRDSILVVGAGYVGLATAVFLADKGRKVHVVDRNPDVASGVASGKLHFKETELAHRLQAVVKAGTLTASMPTRESYQSSDIIIVAIDSVDHANWKMRLRSFRTMAEWIGEKKRPTTVILKSTNILGFAEYFRSVLDKSALGRRINLVVSPEFLREGFAYEDSANPWRVIVGSRTRRESAAVRALYTELYGTEIPVVETSYRGAELIKLAANLYLSHRLAFIHEVADYASLYKLDLDALRQGIGLDPRIGLGYFNPGLGFGGSCLPKDLNLINSRQLGSRFTFETAATALIVNDRVLAHVIKRLRHALGPLNRKHIAMLGCAFKGEVDDSRGSRAVKLAVKFRRQGAVVAIYEPFIKRGTRIHDGSEELVSTDLKTALKGAHAVIVGTAHRQFARLSGETARKLVKSRFVCDPFRILPRKSWEKAGFVFV
jgi:UDPglucose 6-dehydrogenase